jgi:hypothetical protein
MPVRGRGFGKELRKRAETYAVERGCTDAFLDTFSFQARPFYKKLAYRVFGTLENHPASVVSLFGKQIPYRGLLFCPKEGQDPELRADFPVYD